MSTRALKRKLQDKAVSSSKKPCKQTRNMTRAKIPWQAGQIVAQLEIVLRQHGKRSDALGMKKYMRHQFDFFGVKTGKRRELLKGVLCALKDEDVTSTEMRKFGLMLWEKPEREFQYSALDFLEKHRKKFCMKEEEFDENMLFFKSLIVTKSWWDTVDMLAYKLVGCLVQTHPKKGRSVMEDWIECDNMWLRRTAIIHQLGLKGSTDSELLFRFCLLRCHEEEFFIRKAIGWALRDHAKTQPNQVKRFLVKNKDSLSKLSFNEASKHLSLAKK